MLFNSYEYIFVFVPTIFILYFYLNKRKLTSFSKAVLLFGSFFFYGYYNPIYIPLLLSSILFNYYISQRLTKPYHLNKNNSNIDNLSKFNPNKSKKLILTIGVVANISLLGYFKYSDFFIQNVNFIFNSNIELLNLALPLAISFFTFQQIAYLVDSYRGEVIENRFLNYAVFISFFPQLIAGPIVHHKEMMPQFKRLKNKIVNYENIAKGLFIFSIGLFKKVVIADSFAKIANTGFDIATSLNLIEAWIVSLSYTFQLYFDFSGYTDMAIGVALLFNIKLPINFNSPYKALDIQDFWRRWHITLSRFLRDYVYIPLGGSRVANLRVYINLFSVFLIGGLWHGAGWTFIIWGALHGVACIIHRLWKSIGGRLPKVVAWIVIFNFINFSWIFFRANTFADAFKVIRGMLGMEGVVVPMNDRLKFLEDYGVERFYGWLGQINGDKYMLLMVVVFLFFILIFKNSIEIKDRLKMNFAYALQTAFMLYVSVFFMNKISEFLYFNF